MAAVPTFSQDELIQRIKAKLESMPYSLGYSEFSVAPAPTQPAPYVLILGAGFSCGVVPLTRELMHETIGDYYYPDQDKSSLERPARVRQKNSASFWKEFNQAAVKANLRAVELNAKGLPKNPGETYQYLFTYEGANVLFQLGPNERNSFTYNQGNSWLENLRQQRAGGRTPPKQPEKRPRDGERFVKGFLRYVLDPGAEHGYGSTGRIELNAAHIYLAALLEAQQLGRDWKTCAFCRTLLTTNFDTLLQNGLQMVNLLYRLTDRPEAGLNSSELSVEEGPIHLVYVHGSILRHNPASTEKELGDLKLNNADVLRRYLESREVIVIGYSGWKDGLMAALESCNSSEHKVYWCDLDPQPASHVASFLKDRADHAAYIPLGKSGADGLMRALYAALIPAGAQLDPMQQYYAWHNLIWNRRPS